MMFSILRPFLFNIDPEIAHDLAIKSLKFNPLPSKMFEIEDEQMLKVQLLGKNFPNPSFNSELYASALLSKPAARPMGLGKFFPNN